MPNTLHLFAMNTTEMEKAVIEMCTNQGKSVSSVLITVNEETDKDVALIETEDGESEIEVDSMFGYLSKKFSVTIEKYDGYHINELVEGYVFHLAS